MAPLGERHVNSGKIINDFVLQKHYGTPNKLFFSCSNISLSKPEICHFLVYEFLMRYQTSATMIVFSALCMNFDEIINECNNEREVFFFSCLNFDKIINECNNEVCFIYLLF